MDTKTFSDIIDRYYCTPELYESMADPISADFFDAIGMTQKAEEVRQDCQKCAEIAMRRHAYFKERGWR